MLQEILAIIKRFRFEELESSVMPIFPEISWSDIKSELVKCHKPFTSTNVAQFFKKTMTGIHLNEEDLKDRLLTLKLLDISWHNKRITWYGYTFKHSNKPNNFLMNEEIEENMQKNLSFQNVKMNVKVNTHSGITYIALFENGRKTRTQKYISAIYISLFMGQKFFFCSRKYISTNVLNGVTSSLGYGECKRLKLMGKDLRSLSRLCRNKIEGVSHCDDFSKTLEYKDANPETKKTGIDFTQQKQRKKYSETCFGDTPPTLESLVLKGPSIPVVHKDILNKLPNESIHAMWEFRSHNIAKCLTKLIELRILATPLPYYISNLMVLGKNNITLKCN